MRDVDLTKVILSQISWIAESASQMMNWLIYECKGDTWTPENQVLPGIYRSSVEFITYESLFVDHWSEKWFQDGVKAFGLLALEHEALVRFGQDSTDRLKVIAPGGKIYSVDSFLNGESLSFRYDSEYLDLSWNPVAAVGHIIAEYRPEEYNKLT